VKSVDCCENSELRVAEGELPQSQICEICVICGLIFIRMGDHRS
jgi:hypothetical protein